MFILLNELFCDGVFWVNEVNIFLDLVGVEIFIIVVIGIGKVVGIILKFVEVIIMFMEISFLRMIILNSVNVELLFCGSN